MARLFSSEMSRRAGGSGSNVTVNATTAKQRAGVRDKAHLKRTLSTIEKDSLRYKVGNMKPWMDEDGTVIWSKSRIFIAQWVLSQTFETVMGVIIAVNILLMVFETNADAKCYPEFDGRLEACPYRSTSIAWLQVVNILLLVLYTLECFLRAFVERGNYPWNRWNQIDLVTVVLGWVGVFVSTTTLNFNVLRIIRVVRLMRAARVVISIPEFYILVSGLTSSFKAILFGSVMLLSAGNERFATGAVTAGTTSGEMRKALVKYNQAPHSAIIGCADSRVPVDTIFDATPGELFVLRNAGNTCTHAEGSMVGSLEFCTGKLGSRLIMVLGHTQCGAIAGATATHQAGGEVKAPGCALEGLLQGLASVAKEASDDLGPGVSQEKLVSHAVKVNVFNSMNFLLQFSEPIRELVRKGELDIQGGIYHLETGRVEFLGRSPRQDELLSSKLSLPPSMAMGMVRTSEDGTLEPKVALKMLEDGNHRFVTGAPVLGKVDRHMREASALKGQAPHTAVVGCADSHVPLETVFDALPGDLFVLRNAGNTCTHAEGSTLGSLEFCTGALNTRLIFVLGHTNCGALKGATAAYLSQEKRANHALDVLLNELGSVVSDAKSQCGRNATADEIASKAVKLNVFHTMNFMLKHCDAIREKVRSGQLEIQGGVYDLSTGKVEFLGKSPQESKLIKGSSSVAPSLKHKIAGA